MAFYSYTNKEKAIDALQRLSDAYEDVVNYISDEDFNKIAYDMPLEIDDNDDYSSLMEIYDGSFAPRSFDELEITTFCEAMINGLKRLDNVNESRHHGHMLKESEEKQTMYMDDVHLKNLTMDGEIYDRWGWDDIINALWQQVVDKDNIEDIVRTAFAENKHWKNPTNRGWFPVLTKFSGNAGKAYFALKNENGRQSKDQVLVSWTPVTEDEL